jgi:hypothetical protein
MLRSGVRGKKELGRAGTMNLFASSWMIRRCGTPAQSLEQLIGFFRDAARKLGPAVH